jgi:hypothetical protein
VYETRPRSMMEDEPAGQRPVISKGCSWRVIEVRDLIWAAPTVGAGRTAPITNHIERAGRGPYRAPSDGLLGHAAISHVLTIFLVATS